MRRNPVDHKLVETAKSAEQASAQQYVEGICPHCGQQMALSSVGDLPSWVCVQDRTALPVKLPEVNLGDPQ